MTGTIDRIGTYKVDHSTFGGELTPFDFDGHHTMATMTSRIIRSFSFDRRCQRNIQTKGHVKKKTCKESEEQKC